MRIVVRREIGYAADGRLETVENFDEATGELTTRISVAYTDNGKTMTVSSDSGADGTADHVRVLTFDDQNTLVLEQIDGHGFGVRSDGETDFERSFKYDSAGNLTQMRAEETDNHEYDCWVQPTDAKAHWRIDYFKHLMTFSSLPLYVPEPVF